MKEKVTVIIPNYNHSKYLEKRIQCVLQQSYENFDVIILDDASTDNSMDIIQKYASSPCISKIIRNEHNSGSPFIQWKKGIDLAEGDIIWIAESDDYCENDFLEKMVRIYEKYDCSIAFSRSKDVDEDGNIGKQLQRKFKVRKAWDGKTFIKKYLTYTNSIINASGVIFNKKRAQKISDIYTKKKGAGDWLFWILLAETGNVAVETEPLNYFRKHCKSCTSVKTLNGTDDIENHAIFNYLKDNHYLSNLKKFNVLRRNTYNILYRRTYKDNHVKKEVLKEWNIENIFMVMAEISHLYHKVI